MKKQQVRIDTFDFNLIAMGVKNFIIMCNTSDYEVEDIVVLKEFDVEANKYTGRKILRFVTFLQSGGGLGLSEGYVCIGLNEMTFPVGYSRRKYKEADNAMDGFSPISETE